MGRKGRREKRNPRFSVQISGDVVENGTEKRDLKPTR